MNENCIFCKVVQKKISAKIEFEDSELIAIQDINPQAPVHILIIPKNHIADINHTEDASILGNLILRAKDLARQKNVSEGYRLVFNNGANAGQSVFHIHLHLLGGRKMNWPPG